MNAKPLQILLQTTTPAEPDNWSIDSLSLLRQQLESVRVDNQPSIVSARNREVSRSGSDPVLLDIDRSDFDELWLFALEAGDGLTEDECAAIERFRRRGGRASHGTGSPGHGRLALLPGHFAWRQAAVDRPPAPGRKSRECRSAPRGCVVRNNEEARCAPAISWPFFASTS